VSVDDDVLRSDHSTRARPAFASSSGARQDPRKTATKIATGASRRHCRRHRRRPCTRTPEGVHGPRSATPSRVSQPGSR
jgi:hypothetical protein